MRLRSLLPNRERLLSAFVLVVRLGLGSMFVMSSVPKIRQPFAFLASVYDYELVGPRIGVLVAMVLPWVELFTGVCLLGGVFVSGALLAGLGMGGLFTFVLASALWRDLAISCGCFGSSALDEIGYLTLLRAMAIALFSGAAYATAVFLQAGWWRSLSSEPESGREERAMHMPRNRFPRRGILATE